MKKLMWLLRLILKAAIFFTLFAFALNNQHEAVVRFFFGTEWRAPMVLVVLTAFVLGVAVGAVGMVPRWWRQRRLTLKAESRVESRDKAPTQAVTPDDLTHGI